MNNYENDILWYKLKLKQLSPIHIGQKNYGVLSETRIFIPGWTIWGSLVSEYGRLNGGENKNFDEGKKIFEMITCFYPNIINEEVMFPEFKDGIPFIGDISEKKFRKNFTDTFVSTAIEPEYLSAKDSSLHETEIILPKSKVTEENIYWIGLFGIEKNYKEKFERFKENLREINVGGEISYGFGRMEVMEITNISDEEYLKGWGIKNDGSIYFKSEGGNIIRNYLGLSDDIESISSKLEFVVQYDFSNSDLAITSKGYYFVPGSKICSKKSSKFGLNKGIFKGI